MSKSMAIEGVMKIFLMVAVIIVGMSFLMKAFGIDIIGWLQDKFAGFGVPDTAKAIHIKGDHTADPVGEIWEFHTLNSREAKSHSVNGPHGIFPRVIDYANPYFFPGNDLPKDQCTIFLNLEERASPDRGSFIYVNPGVKIDNECTSSVYDCLPKSADNIVPPPECNAVAVDVGEGDKCVRGDLTTTCKENIGICAGRSRYVNCAGAGLGIGVYCMIDTQIEDVLKIPFGDDVLLASDDCSKKTLCNLLEKQEIQKRGGVRGYNIKYGLLCADGLWQVCKDKEGIVNVEKNFEAVKARCDVDGEGIGTWEIIDLAPEITLTLSPENLQVLPGGYLVVNVRAVDTIGTNIGMKEIKLEGPEECSYSRVYRGETPVTIPDTAQCTGSSCNVIWKMTCNTEGTHQVSITATDNGGLVAKKAFTVEFSF